MATKKIRTKNRCKTAEEMDWPIAASASTGQTKVTEYFPVHRGPTKKLERFKVLIDSEEVSESQAWVLFFL